MERQPRFIESNKNPEIKDRLNSGMRWSLALLLPFIVAGCNTKPAVNGGQNPSITVPELTPLPETKTKPQVEINCENGKPTSVMIRTQIVFPGSVDRISVVFEDLLSKKWIVFDEISRLDGDSVKYEKEIQDSVFSIDSDYRGRKDSIDLLGDRNYQISFVTQIEGAPLLATPERLLEITDPFGYSCKSENKPVPEFTPGISGPLQRAYLIRDEVFTVS